MHKVSIVIPCFNAEHLIGEAIESALGQTWRNLEVIVIDDGSTDESLSVIRAFGDRIRWESGPNRGGNAARNRGWKIATGQFIQFLDADDVLYPNKLSTMVPLALEKGEDTIVASEWETVLEDVRTKVLNSLEYRGGDPFIWCLSHSLITHAPIHWRSNLAKAGGFDESLPRCQEYDLHLRMFKSGLCLHTVAEPLFQVRRQPGSVSSNFHNVFCTRRDIKLKLATAIADSAGSAERLEAIAHSLAVDGRQLVRKGYPEAGQSCFLLAKRISKSSVKSAFPNPFSKFLLALLGPVKTEMLTQLAARAAASSR